MQRQPVSCAWPCDLWPRTRLGRPPGKRLADSTVSSGVCFNVTHQKAHRQVFRVCLQVAPHEPEQRTGSMGLRIQSSSGRSQCPCRQRLRPDRFSCRRQLLHFLHQLNRAQVLPLKKNILRDLAPGQTVRLRERRLEGQLMGRARPCMIRFFSCNLEEGAGSSSFFCRVSSANNRSPESLST